MAEETGVIEQIIKLATDAQQSVLVAFTGVAQETFKMYSNKSAIEKTWKTDDEAFKALLACLRTLVGEGLSTRKAVQIDTAANKSDALKDMIHLMFRSEVGPAEGRRPNQPKLVLLALADLAAVYEGIKEVVVSPRRRANLVDLIAKLRETHDSAQTLGAAKFSAEFKLVEKNNHIQDLERVVGQLVGSQAA